MVVKNSIRSLFFHLYSPLDVVKLFSLIFLSFLHFLSCSKPVQFYIFSFTHPLEVVNLFGFFIFIFFFTHPLEVVNLFGFIFFPLLTP